MRLNKADYAAFLSKSTAKKSRRAANTKFQAEAAALATGNPVPKKRAVKQKSKPIGQLEKILWAVFSLYIRLRDKIKNNGLCFYCEKNPIECAMHRIKRGKRATKYDERNSDGGCHTCNTKDQFWPQEFDAIFIRKKGVQLFLELEEKSRQFCPRTRIGILELTEVYRKKIGEFDK